MRYGAGVVEREHVEYRKRRRLVAEEPSPAAAVGSEEGGPDLEGSEAAVFDLEILECTICTEPLAAPIYQCANGHVACAACSTMTHHVCPSCKRPTGGIRCLALEKLIESLHVKCQFAAAGCPALVKFSAKASHERLCSFAPLSCPFPECSHFSGRYQLLQDHVQRDHPGHWTALVLHAHVNFSMTPSDRFHLLFHSGLYFILHRRKSSVGDLFYLTLPKVLSARFSAATSFPYRLQLKTSSAGDAGNDVGVACTFKVDGHCCVDEATATPPPHGCVVVPEHEVVEVAVMLLPPRPSAPPAPARPSVS